MDKALNSKAGMLEEKLSVLIISENPAEIHCSEMRFSQLGYEIHIVRSLADILRVAYQTFDLIFLSTSIQSFGLNFPTLLFKRAKSIRLIKPLVFLSSHQDSLQDNGVMQAMRHMASVDGLITFKH